MAYHRNDLYSISNGVLKSYVPIRFHERGVRENGVWRKKDDIIVMMMSDVLYYKEQIKGVETGDWRKKFITPISYIACAGGNDAPRMSTDADRAYNGTFTYVNVEGEDQWVLHSREEGDISKDVHLLVREGWKPSSLAYFKSGHYNKNFGKYKPMIVNDMKHRRRMGVPWAFQLGGTVAALRTSDAVDESETGEQVGISKRDTELLGGGGRILFFGLFRVPDKGRVLGQKKNGEMWLFENRDGEGVPGDAIDAEKLRPLFDKRERELREQDKLARVERILAERQKRKVAGPQIIEDQKAAPPPVEEVASPETIAAAEETAEAVG